MSIFWEAWKFFKRIGDPDATDEELKQAEKRFNDAIDKDRNNMQMKHNARKRAISDKASEDMIKMHKEYLEEHLREIQRERHKIAQPFLIRAALIADKGLLTPEYRQELKNKWILPQDFDFSFLDQVVFR